MDSTESQKLGRERTLLVKKVENLDRDEDEDEAQQGLCLSNVSKARPRGQGGVGCRLNQWMSDSATVPRACSPSVVP